MGLWSAAVRKCAGFSEGASCMDNQPSLMAWALDKVTRRIWGLLPGVSSASFLCASWVSVCLHALWTSACASLLSCMPLLRGAPVGSRPVRLCIWPRVASGRRIGRSNPARGAASRPMHCNTKAKSTRTFESRQSRPPPPDRGHAPLTSKAQRQGNKPQPTVGNVTGDAERGQVECRGNAADLPAPQNAVRGSVPGVGM